MFIDLYNRDLETTIILFKQNVSSHKTDLILSDLLLPAMSCLLCRLVSSLMNVLEGECLLLCEVSVIVNKSLAVLLLPVLFTRYFLYCNLLLPVYFLILLFCILMMLVYSFMLFFYTEFVAIFLFIRWACKQVHYFCLWSFCLSFWRTSFPFS